jgi:type II secretory pathway component PulF
MPISPASSLSPLQFNIRADLFKQLGAMEEAGLPIQTALSLTRLPPRAQPRLTAMRQCLSKGLGIAEAGLKSRLFTPLEASLLHAAFSAGNLVHMYQRLSDYYARRAAHVASMKSRMMLPLVMLVLAIFVRPLPSLIAGTLSPGGFLIKCFLGLIVLGGTVWLLAVFPYRSQSGGVATWNIELDRVLPLVPLFGSMYVRRAVRDCFETLALLLEAGMPILEALPLSVDTVQSPALKERFSQIKPRIEGGASFAQAVGELSFAGRAQAHAMILAGETAGALPEVLFAYSESETMAINRFDDLVAEWAPRLVYTLAALWIGYGIVRSGAFMPSLPPDLR